MSASCAQCGSPLQPGAKACGRCGTARRAGEPAYGMLDLDRTEGSLALDTADDPRPRKNRAKGRPDSGPVRAPGAPTTGSSAAMRTPGAGSTLSRAQAPAPAASKNATLGASGKTASATSQSAAMRANAANTTTGSRSVAKMPGAIAATPVLAGAGSGATFSGPRPPTPSAEPPAWGGVVLGDNPLDAGYGDAAAPALDIDEKLDPRRRGKQFEEEAPPRELTPAEKRAKEIETIAGYGPRPKNIVGSMGYWVRVTLRKRVLDQELASLSAQRKRNDDAARDALAKLGEALHSRRADMRLGTLAKQIEAVASSEAEIGNLEKAGAQRKQSIERERAQIEDEVKSIEEAAAPLRERETDLNGQVEAFKVKAKRADMQRKRLEQDIESARKKASTDPNVLARLQAERDAVHGEVQTLGVQVGPLEDELSVVRKELSVHLRKLATLQQEQQAAVTALERAQSTHRVTSGSARGARRDALSALAQTAIENGLAALVPEDLKAVQEAAQRRDRKRAEEELHRAATFSFDEAAYKQGMMLLVGGSGAILLSLILVVIF